METTNLTEGKAHYRTFELRFCSTEYTEGIHSHLSFLSVLNILLSITAFLLNTLILVALHKDTSLHTPSKLLFRCLATTDLGVGISEPFIVIYWMSILNESWEICRTVLALMFVTASVLTSVSLMTLTAISVDRFLALQLGLKYRQVVTLKRTYMTMTAFWFVAVLGAAAYFWNYRIAFYLINTGLPVCLIVSVFSYAKIFLTLRHRQTQVQIRNNQELSQYQTIPLNIARYRKAVSNTLWLQFVLLVCCLPYGVLGAFTITSSSMFFAYQVALTLLYMNSSLNPLLYCWKIKEVRHAVKRTVNNFAVHCVDVFGCKKTVGLVLP